jgi:hypothetical protein
MIAGHVVVQVFPTTFDLIVIWTVGRQKVKLYFSLQRLDNQLCPLAFVDAVVVEYQMNANGIGIVFQY